MAYALDSKVLFQKSVKLPPDEMAAHEAILVGGYYVLARVPFSIRSDSSELLVRFDAKKGEVTGDAYMVDILRSHTRILSSVAQDLLVGLSRT